MSVLYLPLSTSPSISIGLSYFICKMKGTVFCVGLELQTVGWSPVLGAWAMFTRF